VAAGGARRRGDVSGAATGLKLTALTGLPNVAKGDDLAALLRDAAARAGLRLAGGVLVVCQKIVSKAEGRVVALSEIEPSERARVIAAEDDKDPRHVEVVLRESVRLVRRGHGVMICETRHGFVCANAGVDLSNAPADDTAVLLPEDADASAHGLRDALRENGDDALAVIVSDTFGRPWREGLVDVAIGCAGLAPVDDLRGRRDWMGRDLAVTTMATADQFAAAAGLLMEKGSGIPAVWIDGLTPRGDGALRDTLRDSESDLFR
jgi:coenzyme F420-0:L-glutamate ligase/coenzyme F420-1:gamma-L-glutamate ligase